MLVHDRSNQCGITGRIVGTRRSPLRHGWGVFYFILFYFILFYFILFYFILFYFNLI
jgi:hypothetical protein